MLQVAAPSIQLWAELTVMEKASQTIDSALAQEFHDLRVEFQNGLKSIAQGKQKDNQEVQGKYAQKMRGWAPAIWSQVVEQARGETSRSKFLIPTITTPPVSKTGDLKAAVHAFLALRALCAENEKKLRAISEKEDGIEELQKLYDHFRAEQKKWKDILSANFPPFASSINQFVGSVIGEMEASLYGLRNKKIKWEEAINAIPSFDEKIIITLVNGHGFQVDHATGEIAETLVKQIRSHQPLEEKRDQNSWVSTFSSVPADLKNDLVMKAYLEVLGWKMTVEGNVVRVDFTPTTPSEPLAHAKQLAEEVYQLCKSTYDKILEINPKKVAISLPQILGDFSHEVLRLQSLFRETGLKDLDRLIHFIKRSSAQLTTGMVFTMRNARDDFNEGSKWEQALAMIVNPNKMREMELLEDKGYRIRPDKVELADLLVDWLLLHKPDESWDDQAWVLKFSKTHPPITFTKDTPFEEALWPPDKEKDFVLKTALEILGWQMTVEEKEDHLMVKISFGIFYFKGAS